MEEHEVQKDVDIYLDKFYETNLEKINDLSKIIQICEIIAYTSFIWLLILITIKVYPVVNMSWFIVLVPAIILLSSLTYQLNMYLKLKDIFDEAEMRERGLNIGSILSYFCLNISAFCLFAYLILFTCRIENMISFQWNLVTVPVYCVFGVSLFYFVFILPAFLQNNLCLEISLVFLYIISAFLFIMGLSLKLDNVTVIPYLVIFSPMLCALSLHVCYSVYATFSKKMYYNNFILNAWTSISLIATMLIPLRADGILNVATWIPGVLYITAGMFLTYHQIYVVQAEEEEELPLKREFNRV